MQSIKFRRGECKCAIERLPFLNPQKILLKTSMAEMVFTAGAGIGKAYRWTAILEILEASYQPWNFRLSG